MSKPFDRGGSPEWVAALDRQLSRLASWEDVDNAEPVAVLYRSLLATAGPPLVFSTVNCRLCAGWPGAKRHGRNCDVAPEPAPVRVNPSLPCGVCTGNPNAQRHKKGCPNVGAKALVQRQRKAS